MLTSRKFNVSHKELRELKKDSHEISNEIPATMSFAKNHSSSHSFFLSRVALLKWMQKQKNGAPYCAPVRLRLKGLELCTWLCLCAATAARRVRARGWWWLLHSVWPHVRAPSSKRRGNRGEKNTPSYLVHFYPLKQFQHCFKIVLSRVIVLCMRPRSSGLRWCARTLDSSRT